jgi:hypothetical protein
MASVRRCRLPSPKILRRERRCSMKERIPLLLMVALFALALFAPAAMAQDDLDDDDVDAATATATATASPTATATATVTGTATAGAEDDDRAAAAAAGGTLPRTGGPALIAPIAGALLIGGGVAAGVALSRSRDDS